MELTTILVTSLFFLVAYFWFRRQGSSLPPCPIRPLPLVGHLFSMASDPRPQFREWRQRCGEIYSLYMGGKLVVVLNGYDLIKEALIKKADAFSYRPTYFVDEVTEAPGKGVTFGNGKYWEEQRAVTLSILKAFGMGKNLLAQRIEAEVGAYTNYLASLKGEPSDIHIMTNISTCNIICSILIGHRFEYDDKDFQLLMHYLESNGLEQKNVSLINFFFWLRYIPGDLFKAKTLKRNVDAVFDHLRKFLDKKKRVIEDPNEVCNLIDAYIVERNKQLKAGIFTYLDDQSLLKIMNDLFGAGTETSSTTIYWCILYLLNNADVQEKVYQEITEKVGVDRTPTIQDKAQLTYLNAVIAETQRLASVVPLSLTHMVSEEVTLKGYTLPKGTFIFPNLDSCLHDSTTWGEDAMSFRPERFIDNNGKLKIPEQFIPFSIGRRACLGEGMAKMELFLFLSSMLQKFQFLPATPGCVPPPEYESGVVIAPKAYEVRAVERKRE